MCIYRIFIHYSLILLVFLIHIFKVLLTLHLLNIFKKAKNETKIFATKRKKSLTGRYKIECVILILIMIYFFLILNSPRS